MSRFPRWFAAAGALLLLGALAQPAAARLRDDDPDAQALQELAKEYGFDARTGARVTPTLSGRRPAAPLAIPDVFGPGAVLTVGNLYMKITNFGFDANPFTNLSSDPSGQWPGASAVEYFNFIALAVGAVNPTATDPTAIRRVSYVTEWRPATLDEEDRMYRAYDGILNGQRYVNDDSDVDPFTNEERIDEDFLDGRDNDGDGLIDEDYAAIGQQMYSCVVRDDTPQAIAAAAAERHVPLGLEARHTAWAYSIPGFTNFNVISYEIFNRSGHVLDSLVVGFRVDMDCGPLEKANFFSDDEDLPFIPHGEFTVLTKATDKRLQPASDRRDVAGFEPDSALCPRYQVRVNGFSIADDDGDEFKTTGVPSVFLINHTIDPLGQSGPSRVNFRAFRSHAGGTPYNQGGNPTIDQQRFEFMTSEQGIDPETGFINQPPTEQRGDIQAWFSVGPYLSVPNDGRVEITIGAGVTPGILEDQLTFVEDLTRYNAGTLDGGSFLSKYPALDNALSAQVAFEGAYEVRPWPFLTNDHGRETPLKAPPGQFGNATDCRSDGPRQFNDRQYEWFDFDCNYCTGAYSLTGGGLFHRTWLAESPPPSPSTNISTTYNYSDNPDRTGDTIPGGDGQITLAWDNLSENTPDPKTGRFDFRGYRIWKVSNWTRPVGSGGPNEDDWALMAEFRYFNYGPTNQYWKRTGPADSVLVCPRLYIPQTGDSMDVCLSSGDLFDRQSGRIIRPDPNVRCVGYPVCTVDSAFTLDNPPVREYRVRYPIGRYRFVDNEVKNGFVYFYSVTAFDSTGVGDTKVELGGRRAAVEAEGVVPQISTRDAKGVWVVPNPYRGLRIVQDRPSAWDLTPNATDPTGTHIDFMGLPSGAWTIKIFTVSGDFVAEIKSTDAVNESVRGVATDTQGNSHPGYNRQQDNPNDGQARWNLISRNGQDVVSGIYLFTVDSRLGTQRGKFVVIR